MSIGNLQTSGLRPSPPVLDAQEGDPSTYQTLAWLASTAGFSTVVPQLQAMLAQIISPTENVVEKLTDNVSLLQENFVENLYFRLEEIGVNLSNKLTLKLNDKLQLQVVGDHPEKIAVNAILATASDLSAVFTEISSQSAALRDIRNLHITVMNSAAPSHGFSEDRYQLSLKGDMNHFYFNR